MMKLRRMTDKGARKSSGLCGYPSEWHLSLGTSSSGWQYGKIRKLARYESGLQSLSHPIPLIGAGKHPFDAGFSTLACSVGMQMEGHHVCNLVACQCLSTSTTCESWNAMQAANFATTGAAAGVHLQVAADAGAKDLLCILHGVQIDEGHLQPNLFNRWQRQWGSLRQRHHID